MIAMQYSFTFPADYDMSIIESRIATKGHATDEFPLLTFKAYLYARRDSQHGQSPENLYAPFYLWECNDGMNQFLGNSGFVALTDSFGWPSVSTWSVWAAHLHPEFDAATCATRAIRHIRPHEALADLQAAESEAARIDVEESGALAGVAGFEPTAWTLVRFRLWPEFHQALDDASAQVYKVGHLSIPSHPRQRKDSRGNS